MRLYLVRRTRSFIQSNYAAADPQDGRKYLTFADGRRSYFPARIPKTVRFEADAQYARLFSDDVVHAVNGLRLPRYGLGNYAAPSPRTPPTPAEAKILDDLSRAGKRLMGFCRTNLFKRLESSGHAFLLSVERHVLRNFVFLHAVEHDLPLPIGTLDAGSLDAGSSDGDADDAAGGMFDEEGGKAPSGRPASAPLRTEEDFRERAAAVYELYAGQYKRRSAGCARVFSLRICAKTCRRTPRRCASCRRASAAGTPTPTPSSTRCAGCSRKSIPTRKVLVFTQFADTVRYLGEQLAARGVTKMDTVTGDSADPTAAARRFSPKSNAQEGRIPADKELRVLIATDVLSEGQNLQDCAVVVNYDLPWDDYPPDSESRPRGPHRPAGAGHPLLFFPSRRRDRASDSAAGPRARAPQ